MIACHKSSTSSSVIPVILFAWAADMYPSARYKAYGITLFFPISVSPVAFLSSVVLACLVIVTSCMFMGDKLLAKLICTGPLTMPHGSSPVDITAPKTRTSK